MELNWETHWMTAREIMPWVPISKYFFMTTFVNCLDVDMEKVESHSNIYYKRILAKELDLPSCSLIFWW